MAEFTFEIEEHLLTLSENEKGWTKEINRVSFNGAPAKFDTIDFLGPTFFILWERK